MGQSYDLIPLLVRNQFWDGYKLIFASQEKKGGIKLVFQRFLESKKQQSIQCNESRKIQEKLKFKTLKMVQSLQLLTCNNPLTNTK